MQGECQREGGEGVIRRAAAGVQCSLREQPEEETMSGSAVSDYQGKTPPAAAKHHHGKSRCH